MASGGFGALLARPLVRAALTSGSVMTLGDIFCQSIVRGSTDVEKNDWSRTGRFGLVGLTLHGPYFLKAFQWLDGKMPPPPKPRFSVAVRKSLFGQVTIFPVYVTAFNLYMGSLEGKSPRQCLKKLQDAFVPIFVAGSFFWVSANLVNFSFVPPTGTNRVKFVAGAGLLWNCFLSYFNATYGQGAQAVQALPMATGLPAPSSTTKPGELTQ